MTSNIPSSYKSSKITFPRKVKAETWKKKQAVQRHGSLSFLFPGYYTPLSLSVNLDRAEFF